MGIVARRAIINKSITTGFSLWVKKIARMALAKTI